MNPPKEVQQKILFVGKERICRQIAYVLDIKDYAYIEKLTKKNFDQYRDYPIYVCDFKRASRKFVQFNNKVATQLNIQYLDDICRAIDEAYAANRQQYANDAQTPVVEREACAQQACQKQMYKEIKHGNLENLGTYLNRLRPSELLLYVLQAKPKPNIRCTRIEEHLRIGTDGNIGGCCSCMVSLGNLLHDGELNQIYNSTYARIVKLSSLNRSYCLCNFNTWCKGYCSDKTPLPAEQWDTPTMPKYIFLSFDHACNLCCKVCRTKPYVMNDTERQCADTTVTKLLRSGWLEQAECLELAGSGETFYSPYYRQILTTDLQRKKIKILSNGTLFNESNWSLIANKYKTIDVTISVDAATAETYQQLRGADFNHLKKNLQMLGDLHKKKQIRKFGLNFIVQRNNFREMPDFVKLGRALGVDRIQFQRLNNFGIFTEQAFNDRVLIIDNQYLDYELWCLLQDPIFQDPIVDLQGLQRYIDASEERYRKRYEHEQKA